ncbi:MAG: hydroxymethylbilane synthase [bacterium]
MKRNLRIGTRGSRLALRQTETAADYIRGAFPDVATEIVIIKTKGDRILDAPLSLVGGKGLFTKELENALSAGEIDVAVHSLKDVPTDVPAGLTIGAVLARENPADALVSRDGADFASLRAGAVVGTSSLRRKAQLARRRPDLRFRDLRGNLDTRLRRLGEGDYDAVVVAAAGLIRLSLWNEQCREIPADVSLPAVGQGAIGIEARDGDATLEPLLAALDHPQTRAETAAERAMMRRLEGGCQVPIGALARIACGRLHLEGCIVSLDGSVVFRDTAAGAPEDAEGIGTRLAERLLEAGGTRILERIRG